MTFAQKAEEKADEMEDVFRRLQLASGAEADGHGSIIQKYAGMHENNADLTR